MFAEVLWILWPQTFFPGHLTLFLLSALPLKGGQPGSCALNCSDLSWFGKSQVSRLEARCQDEAMGMWLPVHDQTLVASAWMWVQWHPHQPPADLILLSLDLHKGCQRPSWQRPERAPCKREGLLPHVSAPHSSLKQSFKLVWEPSDSHSTSTDFLQME